MDKSIMLQKIPLDMYDEYDYTYTKDMNFREYDRFLNGTIRCNAIQAVKSTYYYSFSDFMDKNGMEKFVAMLSGMLYMIEHKELDHEIAKVMMGDIADFETGEFDDLFTETDLKLIKKDIAIIKDYIATHPELIKD